MYFLRGKSIIRKAKLEMCDAEYPYELSASSVQLVPIMFLLRIFPFLTVNLDWQANR